MARLYRYSLFLIEPHHGVALLAATSPELAPFFYLFARLAMKIEGNSLYNLDFIEY